LGCCMDMMSGMGWMHGAGAVVALLLLLGLGIALSSRTCVACKVLG
jgi:hypothetical protein